MSRINKPSPKPNTQTPLGFKVGPGPAAKRDMIKVTDNSEGWSSVANIPVPPISDGRNFTGSLGLNPVLVNGGVFAEPIIAVSKDVEKPGEVKSPQAYTPLPSPKVTAKIVEIDWYGAKLSLPCINAIHQTGDLTRGGQEWLMLEMAIDPKTGKPPWLPPVAQLGEDGRISIPEFQCSLNGVKIKCQILNIELYDVSGQRYIVVLRVVK